MTGTIRRLIDKPKDGNVRSQFGYLRCEGFPHDVFFVPSSFDPKQQVDWTVLREGQQVEAEVVQAPKGPRAKNMRVL